MSLMRLQLTRFVLSVLLIFLPAQCQRDPVPDLKFQIGAIDRSADPCVDFYQYACGGWMARNPIPPDRSYWAVFQQMRDSNQMRVMAILERAAQVRPDRPHDEQRIGDYYASCVDENRIEDKGLDPLRPELERIDAIKNSSDLAEEVARLHTLGSNALFSLSPDQKLEDATRVIAYLDQSQLSLPEPDYYLSNNGEIAQVRVAYRTHMEHAFALLGQDAQMAEASAQNVLAIETPLARSSLNPIERRDRKAWYHEMTAAQLRQLSPSFSWDRYFAAIGFAPKGEMNVAVPKYMQAIAELASATPLPTWKNYLRWELIRLFTPVLPARFREAEFDFYSRKLGGVKVQRPRTQQCEALTSRDLGEAVGRAYVQQYFPPESKERVLAVVRRLRQAMDQDIRESSWMTDRTKDQALRKLEMVRVMIGYPDRWRDYSRLEIRRGDAFGNAGRSQQFEFKRLLTKIGHPVDRGEFYELAHGVGGYHDNPNNVIVFTAGILQPPFFDLRMDDAINFGLAGGVIGHEISHAFDDAGRRFDGAGNMKDWWTPEDARNYGERAACFVRQYSNYTAVGEVKVNGQLTLGENIADNGGLQLAYRAWQTAGPSEKAAIDGYTPEQRFFLGWAQWRCMNVTEKTARVWARTDEHSPGRWRVNGVVSNMTGFAQAYACKSGDPMVNKEPCRIW